jgi:hypothetical protein
MPQRKSIVRRPSRRRQRSCTNRSKSTRRGTGEPAAVDAKKVEETLKNIDVECIDHKECVTGHCNFSKKFKSKVCVPKREKDALCKEHNECVTNYCTDYNEVFTRKKCVTNPNDLPKKRYLSKCRIDDECETGYCDGYTYTNDTPIDKLLFKNLREKLCLYKGQKWKKPAPVSNNFLTAIRSFNSNSF